MHCVLSGGTQRRAMPRYQSEEMKLFPSRFSYDSINYYIFILFLVKIHSVVSGGEVRLNHEEASVYYDATEHQRDKRYVLKYAPERERAYEASLVDILNPGTIFLCFIRH